MFAAFFLIASEKMIDRYVENTCNRGKQFHIGIRTAVFPAADGLERDTEFYSKFVLRHISGTAESTNVLSDVQFHDDSLSVY